MPYESIETAKKAKFPTTAEEAPLTLSQINHLARIHDAIKKAGSADNPMAVAWAEWKELYEKKDDKWVLKEGETAKSEAFAPLSEQDSEWIPVATVGQALKMNEKGDLDAPEYVFPNAEGFEKAVELFKELKKNGYVSKNHLEKLKGQEVIDQKFEDPFLYAKFNSEGEATIKDSNSTGRSIDATVLNVKGHLLTDFYVPGVSVLYEPHVPACTPEMGCASAPLKVESAESVDFDLTVLNNAGQIVKIRDVYLYLDKTEKKSEKMVKDRLISEVAYLGYQTTCSFYKHDPKLKVGDVIPKDLKPVHTIQIAISAKGKTELEYHEGGGIKEMAEKEEPVTFTGEQVKDMVASAEAKVTEERNNAHAVEITDLEKANETKIKELGTEHETAIKTAEEAAFTRAQARAVFMQKFGLKEDSKLMKSYDEVKTVEDMQGLVNSMEIPMVANAAAGISSASGGQNEDNEIVERLGKLHIPGIEFLGGKE